MIHGRHVLFALRMRIICISSRRMKAKRLRSRKKRLFRIEFRKNFRRMSNRTLLFFKSFQMIIGKTSTHLNSYPIVSNVNWLKFHSLETPLGFYPPFTFHARDIVHTAVCETRRNLTENESRVDESSIFDSTISWKVWTLLWRGERTKDRVINMLSRKGSIVKVKL